MNNSLAVQQVLDALNLCIRSLLVDANMTHEQINTYIRNYILKTFSPYLAPNKVLYTTTGNEFAFSDDFIQFLNFNPALMTSNVVNSLRDNEVIINTLYKFGCHILASQPKLISFIYSFYVGNCVSIVQLWRKEATLQLKTKLYQKRLDRLDFLLESSHLCMKNCDEIEKELSGQDLSLSLSPRSMKSASRSTSTSTLSDIESTINEDIVCNSNVEPCFEKYSFKNMMHSRNMLDAALLKVRDEIQTIKNEVSSSQLHIETYEKLNEHACEIHNLVLYMENQLKNERFLSSNRNTFCNSLKDDYRDLSTFWAYQYEYDLYTMAFFEVYVKRSGLNVSQWYDFNDVKFESKVYDIHRQQLVDVPVTLFVSLIEIIGLLGASAPWCNIKYCSIPAKVKWSIIKTETGELISW